MRNQTLYLDLNRPAAADPVVQTADQVISELMQEKARLHALVVRAAKIIDDATGEVLHDQEWHGVAWQWQKDAGFLPLGK